MSTVVYQESKNNFTEKEQKIIDRDILAVMYSPLNPTESKVVPQRVGEMYIQIAEGSTDRKTRSWISVAQTAGKFAWQELDAVYDLPDQVARTDKANHFEPIEQTIAGHQIISFVDGHDQTPEQSKLPADYDGQFYIAVKTLSDGKKDVGVWVASGNQWLPIVAAGGDVVAKDLAKLKEANTFEETNTFKKSVMMEAPVNLIGDPTHTRMIAGTRIKRDRSPIADAGWKAVVEGEKTIYINETTEPTEISIWTAVKLNPNPLSNTGEWVMTWSSKGSAGVLPDNVALVDKVNVFTPLQQMGDAVNQVFLTGARVGPINPKSVIVPLAFGEVYIRQITGTNNFEFYMAAEEADTESWVRIYDNGMYEGFNQRINVLEDEDTAVNERITMLDADLDRFGVTLGQLDLDMTTLESDVNIVKNNVASLDGRMNIAERQIREVDGRVTALETHTTEQTTQITELGTKVTALENHKDDHAGKITVLETHKDDHATRLTALEGIEHKFTSLDDTPAGYTDQAGKYVRVKNDATGLEFITLPAPDFSGNTPISPNAIGQDSIVTSGSVTPAVVAASPYIILTPTSSLRQVTLPDIVRPDVTHLGINDVREGRKVVLSQQGTAATTVKVNAKSTTSTKTQTIRLAGVDQEFITLEAGKTITMIPMILSGDVNIWNVISYTSTVETTPVGSFVDLTDTPNTLTASKIIAVNTDASALVETTFTTEEVGTAITRATTALGVANATNASFDSFKNSDFDPLKITTTNLGTSVSRIDTKVGQLETQGNTSADKIAHLESAVGAPTSPTPTSLRGRMDTAETRLTTLENEPDPDVSFVQLTDTPATLSANKVLVVNSAGNAVTHSSFSTSDISTTMTTATNAMNKANTLETSIGTDLTANTVKGRIKNLESRVDNLVVWTLYLQGDS